MKITYVIILICIIVYASFNLVSSREVDDLYETYGFSGENLFAGRVWTLVTSIFVHGGPVHLLFNMLALFFFGRALEEDMPNDKFLFIFILGGIVGNLVSMFFYPPSEFFVGASGAIFTVMGVAMVKKPFEFIFFPTMIPVPLILVGILYTLYTVLAFFFGGDPNVAYTAHLGGLALGMMYGFYDVGLKRGFFVVLLMFIVLLILPFVLGILGIFDYTGLIGDLF
jgi:membrane associated rhomboid family serine protease